MGLYAIGWAKNLYECYLQGMRLTYKILVLSSLYISLSVLILLIDVATSEFLGRRSQTIASSIQYNYIWPIFLQFFPDIAYFTVVIIFYVISATIVNTAVYDSVDCYLKDYESHPETITYMCFSILSQGLLLSVGYFSLFITLIQLTTWKAFRWDDFGFILVISSILAGAMKYPKRENSKWNDYFLNSYAIFLSIKATIEVGKWIAYNIY